jgi:CheY-like chemotaxis protein
VLLWLARSVPAEEAVEHYTRILTLNPDHDVARAALEQLRPPAPPAPSVDEYASMLTESGEIEQTIELEAVNAEEEAEAHAIELEQVEAYDEPQEAPSPYGVAPTDAGPTAASQPSTHEEFLVYQNQDSSAVWAPDAQASASSAAIDDIPAVDIAAETPMVAPSDVDSYVAASEHTYASSEASVSAHVDLEYTSTHEDPLNSAVSGADAVEMELDQPEAVSDLDASLDATADIDADQEVAAAALAPEAPPPSTPANIVVAWNCPICLSGAPEEAHRCPTCGSVPTLVDPDLLLETEPVDRRYVLQVIARMKNRRVSGASALFDHHLTLGLAYINAGRLPEGMQHLRKASETRPRDAEFKAQVDAVERQATAKAKASARSGARTNGKAVKTPAPTATPVEVPLAPVAAAETHEPAAHQSSNGNGHNEGRRIILVVDDSPTIQKVVSVTLEAHGHEVVTASDGMEALSKLRTLKPDLVLLDITMPHMDGYQLCRIMRSNDITRNVPIVMLSGKDGLFDKMRGRMAGAASYITKPFAPSTLPPLIDKYCKRAS